jgi:hypothetical protein|tara:strand:- start:645 stop:803 length:159 start_codon:yes stop_codon:yes gene_type:complete
MAIGRNTVEITKREFETVCYEFAQALEESYVQMEEEQSEQRKRNRFGEFTFR